MLYHFNGKKAYKYFYDVIIVLSLTILLLIYFKLICNQWKNLLDMYTPAIPLLNGLAVLLFVIWLGKNEGEVTFFSIGMISIFGFCIFLIWSLASAPQGERTVEATDPLFIDLAAALAEGFALQTFFIPILKKNKNRHKHGKLLLITYILGTIIHIYVSYMGAYSIVNRIPRIENPNTIEDYFDIDHVGTTLL